MNMRGFFVADFVRRPIAQAKARAVLLYVKQLPAHCAMLVS
jgi:hypothetical protein